MNICDQCKYQAEGWRNPVCSLAPGMVDPVTGRRAQASLCISERISSREFSLRRSSVVFSTGSLEGKMMKTMTWIKAERGMVLEPNAMYLMKTDGAAWGDLDIRMLPGFTIRTAAHRARQAAVRGNHNRSNRGGVTCSIT